MNKRLLVLLIVVSGFCYQVESLPTYEASAQSSSPTKEQGATAIDAPQHKAEAPIARGDQTPAPDKIKRSEWVQIFISGFVAVVILWQAWIYNQQRKIMQEMLRNAGVSERAYLGVRDMKIASLKPWEFLTLNAIMFNGGRTPAWGIKGFAYPTFSEVPPVELSPARVLQEKGIEQETFITGGDKRDVEWVSEIEITDEWLRELRDGPKKLFVDVGQRYIDNAGDEQLYTAGSVYIPERGYFMLLYEHHHSNNPN